MPFTRPTADDTDHDDRDAWCIDLDSEDCEPGTVQCPDCGHFPDSGDGEHEWEPGGTWTCAGCGLQLPVVPCQIETDEKA